MSLLLNFLKFVCQRQRRNLAPVAFIKRAVNRIIAVLDGIQELKFVTISAGQTTILGRKQAIVTPLFTI
jgi:hypothetical protein